ncbi:hypothetical protein GCM10007884_42550 [Methylobacterium brachythecii]|uniref:Uncharacterized protein n=1 Tax=Methylobacterium brachythecii TaxID=1176177 RepID=A0ABQ6D9U9_9HYPH|nr:hypothetical protein GCM10007884_42550 [Methylobacterium brachythecii]
MMATEPPADLFSRAGISLPRSVPMPTKRAHSPMHALAAARAASGRLVGARRSRPSPRNRVGTARYIGAAEVLAFPLTRNVRIVSQMSERIPPGYSAELSTMCDREARKLEKRLIYIGINKQSARRCAMDLLHEVYMKRVIEAERGS